MPSPLNRCASCGLDYPAVDMAPTDPPLCLPNCYPARYAEILETQRRAVADRKAERAKVRQAEIDKRVAARLAARARARKAGGGRGGKARRSVSPAAPRVPVRWAAVVVCPRCKAGMPWRGKRECVCADCGARFIAVDGGRHGKGIK
jgi:rubrerythrin